MPTTWPLAVLVVILIAFVLVVVIASLLSVWAMRIGSQIEASCEAASFRFKVSIHPAPTPIGRSSPDNVANDLLAQGSAKSEPSP